VKKFTFSAALGWIPAIPSVQWINRKTASGRNRYFVFGTKRQIFNTSSYFAPSLANTALGMLYSRITASCFRKPHNSRWMK
jgi:hypothetical protein